MTDIGLQLSWGPRIPGSDGHRQSIEWITKELSQNGWNAEVQSGTYNNQTIHNIIGSQGNGDTWIILGAHYDTRIYADEDPDPKLRQHPVPGANDGASGVALLLELSRIIPSDLPFEIWLVFFDAEDNGNIPGWEWIMGSRYFVENLDRKPDKMVLVDMIGDKDLNLFMEVNSDPKLKEEIWGIAKSLGYQNYFIPFNRYAILDDHTPFLEAGIPAVDIIDFSYPYYHTVDDTIDKLSPKSLEIVGTTILEWLLTQKE